MLSKARIAVFVSGGGTNLEALLKAQESGAIPHGEIVLVCASNENAYAPHPGRQPRRALRSRAPQADEPGGL